MWESAPTRTIPPNWSLNKIKRSKVKWRKLLWAPSADALICVSPPETVVETLSELPFICISCCFTRWCFFFACCWQTKWTHIGWKYLAGLASSEFSSMDQTVGKVWAFTVSVCFHCQGFHHCCDQTNHTHPARTHTLAHATHTTHIKSKSSQCTVLYHISDWKVLECDHEISARSLMLRV